MIFKQFLKPDWRKLLILLVLVSLITIIFQEHLMGGWDTQVTIYFIIPFPSIEHRVVGCDFPTAPLECKPESSFNINYSFLLVDLVFWYLISCLIVWVYDKRRKK